MAKNASPRFFRIILPHIIRDGTLELPRNFVEEHWKNLSKHVCLRVGTGAKANIQLKKCDGRAWLDKGWKDFVEKYSIKCGYFLVFRYEDKSCFKVLVFDLSTSEIEYPRASYRKKGIDEVIEINEEDCEDDSDYTDKLHKTRKMTMAEKSISNSHARNNVLQGAKEFRSSNLHFIVVMSASYVSRKAYVHVPKGPVRDYLLKRQNKNIKLKLGEEDGRVWSMEYIIGAPPSLHVRIHLGWKKFLRENNLQEGDVCAFELVNRKDLVFKVTIFRITEKEYAKMNETSTQMQNKLKKRDAAIERAQDFKCNEPSFTTIIRKSCVQVPGRLVIPRAHASRYLMNQHGNEVFLHTSLEGEIWHVQCTVYGLLTRFCSGWNTFVLDNNILEGDTCIFNLFRQVPNHYKVTIFRVVEEVRKKSSMVMSDVASPSRGLKVKQMQNRKRKRDVSVKDYSKDFKCKMQPFTVIMRKTYIQNSFVLSIPVAHSSKYLKGQHRNEIFLHRLDGETWTVKCNIHGSEARFVNGWKAFVVDNDLKEGDTCVFKLLRQVPNLYNVTIFRVAESL